MMKMISVIEMRILIRLTIVRRSPSDDGHKRSDRDGRIAYARWFQPCATSACLLPARVISVFPSAASVT